MVEERWEGLMIKLSWRCLAAVGLALSTLVVSGQQAARAQTTAPTVTAIEPTNGPVGGGTLVTVIGSGFLGPNNQCAPGETVYFGADPQDNYWIPATNVHVISDLTMVVTTPQDYGGHVGVVVHNACGYSTPFYAAGFTYSYANDGQCLSGSCTLNVNGNTDLGPIRHSAEGFLNGYNVDGGATIPSNVPSQMNALHPSFWRVGGNTEPNGAFNLAKGSGAKVTSIWETDWLAEGGSMQPWTQLSTVKWFGQVDVANRENAGTAPDYWDIWNEPDGSGTVSQRLSVYQAAYEGMKAADPNVKVVGPSIGNALTAVPGATGNSSGSDLDISTFANFAVANNLNFAAVTYHDEGEPPPPDWPNGRRPNYTPAALGAGVAEIRSTLASAGLSGTQVFVNEYGPTFAILEPGWTVGSFASLEGAGVDQANLTCADEGACNNLMDGLFTSNGTPQMPYWVMKDYSQMTGESLATSGSGSNITALATKTDSAQQVQMLVGRHDECGPPPRPWQSGGISNVTCPNFQPPTNGTVSASVNVAEPYPLNQVTVTVSPLPNSARSPDGSDPVPSAPASSTMTLSVTNGTVQIPLSSVGDGDAFSIIVAPLTVTGCTSYPCASSPNTTFASDTPANAIDANPATFWQPVASTTTPTVQVNLGAPTSVSTVSTQWYSSQYAPSSYQIQTSPDGATWTTQATVTSDTTPSNNPGPVYNHVLPTPVTTNYLRLVATAFNPAGTDPFAHVALLEMGWS